MSELTATLKAALLSEAKSNRIPWIEYTSEGGCPSCGVTYTNKDCSECYWYLTDDDEVLSKAINPANHGDSCSVPTLIEQYALMIGLDLPNEINHG